jgi:hypothetical protein
MLFGEIFAVNSEKLYETRKYTLGGGEAEPFNVRGRPTDITTVFQSFKS